MWYTHDGMNHKPTEYFSFYLWICGNFSTCYCYTVFYKDFSETYNRNFCNYPISCEIKIRIPSILIFHLNQSSMKCEKLFAIPPLLNNIINLLLSLTPFHEPGHHDDLGMKIWCLWLTLSWLCALLIKSQVKKIKNGQRLPIN